MTKWSPNLVTTTTTTGNLKIQGAQQIPRRINTKATSRHSIIVKLLKSKDKEKIPQPVGDKGYTMYTGKVILIMANFFFKHPESVCKNVHKKKYGWRPRD